MKPAFLLDEVSRNLEGIIAALVKSVCVGGRSHLEEIDRLRAPKSAKNNHISSWNAQMQSRFQAAQLGLKEQIKAFSCFYYRVGSLGFEFSQVSYLLLTKIPTLWRNKKKVWWKITGSFKMLSIKHRWGKRKRPMLKRKGNQ